MTRSNVDELFRMLFKKKKLILHEFPSSKI